MPGCNCEKAIFKTAYDNEVATIKQVNPTWDEHVVRLSAAEILRPRFKADMDSKKTEESGIGEYKVKDEFTLTDDGAIWVGYGRRMGELEERTQSLTPGKYTASDGETTSAIESALRRGARRIVTSYARPGDGNRDLLVIEYNPDTNRGTMTIINTAANGTRHDFESMQQVAKERFADLELSRTSQTTFLLTDIKSSKDQRDVVRQDAYAPSAIKPSDAVLHHHIETPRDLMVDRVAPHDQRGNIVAHTFDTARYAGHRTVSELNITVKKVRDALKQSTVNRQKREQAAHKELGWLPFRKNHKEEHKRTAEGTINQVRRARRSRIFEVNKDHSKLTLQKGMRKIEEENLLKKQKELPRRRSSDVVIYTSGEQQRVKQRTMRKTEAGIMGIEKNALIITEPVRTSLKKKWKLRLDTLHHENRKMKKKEFEKARFFRKRSEKRVQILSKEKPQKREKQLMRSLVVLARLIERRRRLERRKPEVKKTWKGKEKQITSIYSVEKQQPHKEKQKDILLMFSFAWILYRLINTRRNLPRPSAVFPIHLDKLSSEKPGVSSMNRVEEQVVVVKKQGKADYTNDSLPTYETTPWILLSIIWYLTMIREAGIQSSNQQSAQSNQYVAPVVLPVPIRHQGIIFAYHS